MSKETITRIHTEDTDRTYEFPCKDNPQLWNVELRIACVGENGHDYLAPSSLVKASVYLERATLEEAGLLPRKDTKEVKAPPLETVEDMIIRLLEHLGYFPCEHGEG